MSKTAVALIRELANRLGEFVLFTASAAGTTTTITSSGLRAHHPRTIQQWNPWVYATGGTAGNLGQEARATSWSYEQSIVTLVGAGFPNATANADEFELHYRTRRARKLEALNDAIGQLQLYWPRRFIDESITTASNTWSYTIPGNVSEVHKVEVQISTDADQTTYPYEDARPLDWMVRESETATGTRTLTVQFGTQPPPGRKLRLWCSMHMIDLAADADVLPTAVPWERLAVGWIMDWAKYRILDEITERQPGGESERYRLRALDKLDQARLRVIETMRSPAPGRFTVPGMGSAQQPRRGADWEWLGAFG